MQNDADVQQMINR